MNPLKSLLLLLLFFSTAAFAAPASESSIRELLAVTRAEKLLDTMLGQFDTVRKNAVQLALAGNSPSPEEQQSIDRMTRKTIGLLQAELTWEKLEPVYLRLYQDSFSEEEVQAMLDFYRSPAGQSVIGKMPVLMQRSMAEVQAMLAALTPKMQKILQDFAAEMKEARSPAQPQGAAATKPAPNP
jgi:hypothetical protein